MWCCGRGFPRHLPQWRMHVDPWSEQCPLWALVPGSDSTLHPPPLPTVLRKSKLLGSKCLNRSDPQSSLVPSSKCKSPWAAGCDQETQLIEPAGLLYALPLTFLPDIPASGCWSEAPLPAQSTHAWIL
jgi:hypothetical protein